MTDKPDATDPCWAEIIVMIATKPDAFNAEPTYAATFNCHDAFGGHFMAKALRAAADVLDEPNIEDLASGQFTWRNDENPAGDPAGWDW
jgi:acyl-CoA thioesterase